MEVSEGEHRRLLFARGDALRIQGVLTGCTLEFSDLYEVPLSLIRILLATCAASRS